MGMLALEHLLLPFGFDRSQRIKLAPSELRLRFEEASVRVGTLRFAHSNAQVLFYQSRSITALSMRLSEQKWLERRMDSAVRPFSQRPEYHNVFVRTLLAVLRLRDRHALTCSA
jgi:hypothetical protein